MASARFCANACVSGATLRCTADCVCVAGTDAALLACLVNAPNTRKKITATNSSLTTATANTSACCSQKKTHIGFGNVLLGQQRQAKLYPAVKVFVVAVIWHLLYLLFARGQIWHHGSAKTHPEPAAFLQAYTRFRLCFGTPEQCSLPAPLLHLCWALHVGRCNGRHSDPGWRKPYWQVSTPGGQRGELSDWYEPGAADKARGFCFRWLAVGRQDWIVAKVRA